MKNIEIWNGEVPDYKILDSGEGEKLEEIGGTKIVRAEPRAWWKKSVDSSKPARLASESVVGGWKGASKELEAVLDIGIGGIKAKVKYKNTSKHIGIFPEQFPQWKYIAERIMNYESRIKVENSNKENIGINVLNLFGYTGMASLAAASGGARVTHVDASKASIDWARENQKISGMEDAPIRWILDDVVKFIQKEARQGKKYDAIIMDPPSYGRGPKGEVWKIQEQLPELLKSCREILSDEPLFVIFNMYSTELSSLSVGNLLQDMMHDFSGTISSGELVIRQEDSERLLPMSIFAIWESNK